MNDFMRHLKILEFALAAMNRRRYKNTAITLVFTLTISILASVLFLTHALKSEANNLLQEAPELVVQRLMAGRHELIPNSYAQTIATIPGTGKVTPRLWGYYYDGLTGANYTVVAVDADIGQLNLVEGRLPETPGEIAIGQGVAESRKIGIEDDLILIDSENIGQIFEVVGTFSSLSEKLTHDLIVMPRQDVQEFFAFPPDSATDLAVEVYNPGEVQKIAEKIKRLLPDTRPISRSEIRRTYNAVFNWRSGMLLAVFSGALIAFCILAWDKATGLSAEEKKEIGILKAVGWDTADVLELKAWEGLAISLSAFLAGILLAYAHVFLWGAPLLSPILKGWSVLFPSFRPVPYLDLYQIGVMACLTIIPYLASTVIPAWKAAITDPDTIMRQ